LPGRTARERAVAYRRFEVALNFSDRRRCGLHRNALPWQRSAPLTDQKLIVVTLLDGSQKVLILKRSFRKTLWKAENGSVRGLLLSIQLVVDNYEIS